MKILIIKHADFEKPGSIATWAKKHKHSIQEISPYKGEKIPDINDFDFLIVMGGPQSSVNLDDSPYLNDEIALIKQSITKHKRIIGICLGAQLLAKALDANVEISPHREIGMHLIEQLSEAKLDPVFRDFPRKFEVMHWHNDMPGIPAGAILLAKSEGCPHQIFRYGDRIYGFQCHFELTKELVQGMIENCQADLAEGTFVRSVKDLLEADYSEINLKMDKILNYLCRLPELVLQNENIYERQAK